MGRSSSLAPVPGTAGNTIYAAGIGSVGLLQNVIHVPGIQKQLLSISQICNQLHYYYLIDGNKCEVLNSDNEIVHTCYRNNGLYTTRDLSWLGFDLSSATNLIGLKQNQAKQIHAYVAGVAKHYSLRAYSTFSDIEANTSRP